MKNRHTFKGIAAAAALILYISARADAYSQNIRLSPMVSRTLVCADMSRLYNYNRYEGNRWGLGFNTTTPLSADKDIPLSDRRKLYTEVYGAYGVGDRAVKGGGALHLLTPLCAAKQWHLRIMHDVERAASRSLEGYNLFTTDYNSSYLSSRYSMVDRVSGGFTLGDSTRMLTIEGRYSREKKLFDNAHLLYPSIYADDAASPYAQGRHYAEFHATATSRDGWVVDLLAGRVVDEERPYARLLAQYSHTLPLNEAGELRLFAQGGLTTLAAPYTRMFDLSGTAFSYYYFNHTFLTVRPDTFVVNEFAHLCIGYCTPALWKCPVSNPRIFVQLNAAAGWEAARAADNTPGLCDHIGIDSLDAYAPTEGIAEPLIGIERLLRWGVLDLGMAAAFQMTPDNSYYHTPDSRDRWALVVVATVTER